jgi:hypothetical protein
MVRADELAKDIPGEEHHSEWNQDIEHPDAKLIAAAPDLLEALKWVATHAYSGGRPVGAVDIVKNAIEKAEGRSK